MARRFPLSALSLLLLLPGAVADEWQDGWDDWAEQSSSPVVSGFVETAQAQRLQDDPALDEDATLSEMRLRAESAYQWLQIGLSAKGELWYDGIDTGWHGEFRQLSLSFSPTENIDVIAGRQVLTWGTGQYLFLNDLFAKDWQSFFSGREDEYLKAASDTLRFSYFSGVVNLDMAWTPWFEPDRYLNGERLSFFSSEAGGNVAPETKFSATEPDDGELAVRLYQSRGVTEWALYGYYGYFKQPLAVSNNGAYFPELVALGGSLRQPLGSGIVNAEFSYYQSREDRNGSDAAIPNSQWRFLLGYERELMRNLTFAGQYYLEWTRHHGRLIASSATPQYEPDQDRHVITAYVNYRAWQERLTLSLFSFWSPSDKDYFLRPAARYRFNDQWSATLGGNLLGGDNNHTLFAQMADASNLYLRVRYHY